MTNKHIFDKAGYYEIGSKLFNRIHIWYIFLHCGYWCGLLAFSVLLATGVIKQQSFYGLAVLTLVMILTIIFKCLYIGVFDHCQEQYDITVNFDDNDEKMEIITDSKPSYQNYDDIFDIVSTRHYYAVFFKDGSLVPLNKNGFDDKKNGKKLLNQLHENYVEY